MGIALSATARSCDEAVQFQEILYRSLSGDTLQVRECSPAVHSSGPLGCEVDFADQGVAEEDQDAMVDALESDGLRGKCTADVPGLVGEVDVSHGVDSPDLCALSVIPCCWRWIVCT